MSQGKIIGDRFRLGKKIGEGTSGSVFTGEPCDAEGRIKPPDEKGVQKKYAIKVIPLATVEQNLDQTKREIAILKTLRHRHVVALREVLQSANNVYLVMELVEGGTLQHLPLPLGEDIARGVMQQLLQGLQYVHQQGVAHRDLKPANVMIKRYYNTDKATGQKVQTGFSVKLADFGLANIHKDASHMLTTRCGTPHYVAPEIVDGRMYDGRASDVWSCGVLLYFILTGRVPFDDSGLALAKPNFDGLWNKIRTANFVMPKNFSPEVQQLLRAMLTTDPLRRATVDDCLANSWVSPPKVEAAVDSTTTGATAGTTTPTSQTQTALLAAKQGLRLATSPLSPPASPSKSAYNADGTGDDRRRSEQEEVVGGDAFLQVGAERVAFLSSTGSSDGPTSPGSKPPGAGGTLKAEDLQALYQELMQVQPLPAGGERCVFLGSQSASSPMSSFKDAVQAVSARLQALGVDVRGAAIGVSKVDPRRAEATFAGTTGPHIAKAKALGLTSVVPIDFKVTSLAPGLGGGPDVCVQASVHKTSAEFNASSDFNKIAAAMASELKA